MPAQISHILAAEEALLRGAPALAEAWGLGVKAKGGWAVGKETTEAAAWFRLGAQGPDIFYHNQRTHPSGLHYGPLCHRRNYGLTVEAMCAALIDAGTATASPEAAWLLGFATHAAVDRVIHPFIVYFSGWQLPLVPESARYRSCHPFLERLLDIDILARLRGLSIGDCDLEDLLPLGAKEKRTEFSAPGPGANERLDGAVVRLIATGLRAAFPRAAVADFLIERRIQNALADARYFLRVTNPALTSAGSASLLPWFDDRSGWRSMALIYPEALPEGLDIANEARNTWEHPAGDGRSRSNSHAELFEEAIQHAAEAVAMVVSSLEKGGMEAGFATAIGNGGLSVTDGDGIPVPPRLSQPLALKEAMEKEFERRIAFEREWTSRTRPL
ncbi:MAG TPA: zinc dependent phospholipase C family protein [Rectinemataceae bacterium]|nr:zinc dependent phospholipase C family protein [Rectinemataceae bacterium]